MPHLLANVVGHAESAARAESQARRPARDTAGSGDDAFAAILDRVSSARGDASRPRIVDDGASVADASDAAAPDIAPRHPIVARATENPAKQPAPAQQQQQPTREGRKPDENAAPQAAARASDGGEAASGGCETCDTVPHTDTPAAPLDQAAHPSSAADAAIAQAPTPLLSSATPVAAVAMPLANAHEGNAAAPDMPIAAPMSGPMPLPDMPGDGPPAMGPMQPGAPMVPAALPTQAMPPSTGEPARAPANLTAEAAAPATAPAPQASSPTTTANSAAPASGDMADAAASLVSRGETPPPANDDAGARPIQTTTPPAQAAQTTTAPARPDIVVPPAAVASTRERSARAGEPSPVATSPTVNAAPTADGAIAQNASATGTALPANEPSLARAAVAHDDAPAAPPLPVTTRGAAANADDPATAARQGGPRNAAQPNTALAAQLAQQDPVTQTSAPVPVVAAGPGNSADTARTATDWFGAFHGEVAADEIAPVRHAIALPAEASAAPSRVDAAQETAAARTARMPMHPAIAQVAVSVTKAVQEGVDRITIKLQPPELGRIDVRIEVGVDGRLQAVFAAERQGTVEILQRDVRELERSLQNAGLSTDSGSLSFGLKQNGGQNANAFAAFQREQRSGRDDRGDDDAPPMPRPSRATADGRLDIHV